MAQNPAFPDKFQKATNRAPVMAAKGGSQSYDIGGQLSGNWTVIKTGPDGLTKRSPHP